tara:strand:- start:1916 stop:2101 length:186 start_codon:yes stop_codon:yes gene_type:complete
MEDTILKVAYVIFVSLAFIHGYMSGRDNGIKLGANSLYELLLLEGEDDIDGTVKVSLSRSD